MKLSKPKDRRSPFFKFFTFTLFVLSIALIFKITILDKPKDGLVKERNNKGDVIAEKTYENGVLNGPFKLFDESGNVTYEGMHVNGEKSGEITYYEYYPNNKLKGSYTILATLQKHSYTGPFTIYYESGQPLAKGGFKDGLLQGTTIYFDESGEILEAFNLYFTNKINTYRDYYNKGSIDTSETNRNFLKTFYKIQSQSLGGVALYFEKGFLIKEEKTNPSGEVINTLDYNKPPFFENLLTNWNTGSYQP